MQEFADRCNAYFMQLDDKADALSRGRHIADAVALFDKALVIDADAVVSRLAPNIFHAHHRGMFMAMDSLPSDREALARSDERDAAQGFFGSIGWTSGYYNSGVVLCLGTHAPAFRDWRAIPRSQWSDQTCINYRARQLGYHLLELAPEWNRFSLNTGHTENTQEALDAILKARTYIAHAAGHLNRAAAVEYLDQHLP